MTLLGIAPRWDAPTEYSSRWHHNVLDNYEIVDLSDADATRQKTENAIQEHSPEVIVFSDHGSETILYAQWGHEGVFDLNNAYLMKGRSIYTLACLAAAELLPKMILEKALAAWGYYRPYGFYTGIYEPYFEEQGFIGLRKLLEKKTFNEAKEAFYVRCYEMVDELDRKGAPHVADQLIWNLESLRVLGNLDTKIPVPPYIPKPAPPPTCPVSRIIAKLFGYKTLEKLRRIRDKVKTFSWPS